MPRIRYALHLKSHLARSICTLSLVYSLSTLPWALQPAPHWYSTSFSHWGSRLELYSVPMPSKYQRIQYVRYWQSALCLFLLLWHCDALKWWTFYVFLKILLLNVGACCSCLNEVCSLSSCSLCSLCSFYAVFSNFQGMSPYCSAQAMNQTMSVGQYFHIILTLLFKHTVVWCMLQGLHWLRPI